MMSSQVVLHVDPRFARSQRKREIPKIVSALFVGLILFWLGAYELPIREKLMIAIVSGALFALVLAFSYRWGERVFGTSRIQFKQEELAIQLGQTTHRIQRKALHNFDFINETGSKHWILRPQKRDLPDIKIRKEAFPSFMQEFLKYSRIERDAAPNDGPATSVENSNAPGGPPSAR